jgi:hypothetical protein
MLRKMIAACALGACPLFNVAQAHHGLDFLEVETAHLPEPGTGYAFARVDRVREDGTETEIAPAVLFGATDWLAVEVHAHYAKVDGESLHYEAVAPALHFRLTPSNQQFSFGISTEYEVAHSSDDKDVLDLAAVFGYQMYRWTFAGNLTYERLSGESGEWGYALGVRNTFKARHGLGVELIGSLESGGSAELLIGYYGELAPHFTLNAGLGTGIDGELDHTARAGVIWQFK